MKGILTVPAPLQVGDPAPDFELPALIGGVKRRFRLSEWNGTKNIVLIFYPLNWEPSSARQMVQGQAERDKFTARDAEIVAISVDSIMNTTAWEREIGPFDYPICSDFWPHGEVAARYGVLRPSGESERAIFVIDKSGRIVFRKIYDEVAPAPLDEVLDAVSSL